VSIITKGADNDIDGKTGAGHGRKPRHRRVDRQSAGRRRRGCGDHLRQIGRPRGGSRRGHQGHGAQGRCDQADSADGAAVQASVEKAVAALGGLDILVNNAGILRVAELKDITLADIDALLNVNVRAQIIASKAALAHLGKGGRIITIGSYFADRVPASVLSVYAATKSALTAFTKGLTRELGPKEITVNLVQPGSIDTDMNPAHGPYGDTLRQFMALGHYGVAEDIANAVAFLASPKAQYITGSTLTVDGGSNA
jgi:3-oxoacyl-[acyl-carrier protein] reductase